MARFPLRLGLAFAGVAFLSLVVAVTVAIGDDDVQPAPLAGIQNIMNAVNHEEFGVFGEIKKFCAAGGGDADAWKLNRHRAMAMSEVGNSLWRMTPPRGADTPAGMKAWRTHCVEYSDACKDLGKALAYKKPAKAEAAIAALTARCEACHKDHKSQ